MKKILKRPNLVQVLADSTWNLSLLSWESMGSRPKPTPQEIAGQQKKGHIRGWWCIHNPLFPEGVYSWYLGVIIIHAIPPKTSTFFSQKITTNSSKNPQKNPQTFPPKNYPKPKKWLSLSKRHLWFLGHHRRWNGTLNHFGPKGWQPRA